LLKSASGLRSILASAALICRCHGTRGELSSALVNAANGGCAGSQPDWRHELA
jgi:hypothetical protein